MSRFAILEKRLLKLEKQIANISEKAATPNIFSNKLAEVKSGIDDGENINQINTNGRTPLVNALLSRSNSAEEIALYLLNNGADLNIAYKNEQPISIAIRKNKYNVVKSMIEHGVEFDYNLANLAVMSDWPWEEVNDLISDSFIKENPDETISFFKSASHIYRDNTQQSVNFVSQFLPRMLDLLPVLEVVGSLSVNMNNATEVNSLTCKIISENGYLPTITVNIKYINTNSYASKAVISNVCSVINDYISGRLTVLDKQLLYNWSIIADIVGKQSPENYKLCEHFINETLNQKIINELGSDVWTMFNNNLKDNLQFAKRMSKFKFAPLDKAHFKEFIDVLINSEKSSEYSVSSIRLLCTTLERYISGRIAHNLDFGRIEKLARLSNEYILNFLIDVGFGPYLAAARTKSDECFNLLVELNYLDENGNINKNTKDIMNTPFGSISRDELINKIINSIENEKLDRALQEYINKNVDLLFDDEVQRAINEHPNSIIGRQLKMIADRNKQNDLYDL